jgi:hypothetical protein
MKTVLAEKEQFIVDGSGRRVGVVLDLPTYERLRESAEDNADIRAYRSAKTRVADEVTRGARATLEEYRAKRARKRK